MSATSRSRRHPQAVPDEARDEDAAQHALQEAVGAPASGRAGARAAGNRPASSSRSHSVPDVPLMPRSGRLATTAAVGLSFLIATLDITVVIVGLPAMARDLHTSLDQAQWVVNAYTLTFASVMLAAGALSDRLGRRALFVAGHVLFALASAACMLSVTPVMLITARGVQGLGAALVIGTAMALISDAFQGCPSKDRRAAVTGATVLGALAMGLGPIVGGAVIDFAGHLGHNQGWPWIFALNLPVCVVVIALVLALVPDVSGQIREAAPPVPLDLVTLVGTIVGLYALNFGVVSGTKIGWTSPLILAALVIGVVVIGAIAVTQVRRGQRAMIDPSLFRIPTFTGALSIGLLMRMFSFGFFPFVIFWVTGVAHASPFQTGVVLLAMSIPSFIAAGPAMKAGQKYTPARVVGVGAIAIALGLVALAALAWVPTVWALVPGLVILGVGSGMMMPFMMDLVIAVVPPHKAGVASGVANAAMPLGTSVGVAIWGALLAVFVHVRIPAGVAALHHAAPGVTERVRALVQVGEVDKIAHLPGLGQQAVVACGQVLSSGVAVLSVLVAIPALLTSLIAFKMIREEDNWVAD